MDNVPAKHPLEDYPFEDLSPGISRRDLFKVLVEGLHQRTHSEEGVRAMRLPALGKYPVELLVDLIPAIRPGTKILVKEQAVWGQPEGRPEPVFLFAMDPVSTFTFNLINGKIPIGEIARRLAEEKQLPGERALAITRGLFLTLVKAGACVPVNNPFNG